MMGEEVLIWPEKQSLVSREKTYNIVVVVQWVLQILTLNIVLCQLNYYKTKNLELNKTYSHGRR